MDNLELIESYNEWAEKNEVIVNRDGPSLELPRHTSSASFVTRAQLSYSGKILWACDNLEANTSELKTNRDDKWTLVGKNIRWFKDKLPEALEINLRQIQQIKETGKAEAVIYKSVYQDRYYLCLAESWKDTVFIEQVRQFLLPRHK